jgi:hypothetical protein
MHNKYLFALTLGIDLQERVQKFQEGMEDTSKDMKQVLFEHGFLYLDNIKFYTKEGTKDQDNKIIDEALLYRILMQSIRGRVSIPNNLNSNSIAWLHLSLSFFVKNKVSTNSEEKSFYKMIILHLTDQIMFLLWSSGFLAFDTGFVTNVSRVFLESIDTICIDISPMPELHKTSEVELSLKG